MKKFEPATKRKLFKLEAWEAAKSSKEFLALKQEILLYASERDALRRRNRKRARIRLVMEDPTSNRAIYRGFVHIEESKQDPQSFVALDIEKVIRRYE